MAEQTVTLQPGESKVVSFEATPLEARTYQVAVNGLAGSFKAIVPAAPIILSNAAVAVSFVAAWGGYLAGGISYDVQGDQLYDTVYNPATGLYEPWIVAEITLNLTTPQGLAVAGASPYQAIPRPITTTKQRFSSSFNMDWAGRAVDFAEWIQGSLVNYSFSIQIKIAGIAKSNIFTGSGQLTVS